MVNIKFLSLIVLLVAVLLLAGCAMSKSSYEGAMTNILEQAKSDLQKADQTPSKDDPDRKNKKVISALEDAKAKIEKLKPPDEFFGGHSDVKEFLTLTIKMRRSKPKPLTSARRDGNSPEEFVLADAARQALDRARREMPFLDYELNQAFASAIKLPYSVAPAAVETP